MASVMSSIAMIDNDKFAVLLTCMGRREVFFPFDYFAPGGIKARHDYCSQQNFMRRVICLFSTGITLTICSNICEIYFHYRIITCMRNSTETVKNFLSSNALKKRLRENGIVMAITFWQWLAEFILQMIFVLFLSFIMGRSRLFDHSLFCVMIFLLNTCLPTFTFLSDSHFREG